MNRLVIIIIIIYIFNQNFITNLINKINKNIKIGKFIIKSPRKIIIKNFSYYNKYLKTEIKKISFLRKKNNTKIIKINNIKISLTKTNKTLVKKINTKILIKKNNTIIIPYIRKINDEIYCKIILDKYKKTLIKKCTIIYNKNIIKNKKQKIDQTRIKTKNIQVDFFLTKNNNKRKIFIRNLIYFNINVKHIILVLKKKYINIRILRLKHKMFYTKEVEAMLIINKNNYKINIQLLKKKVLLKSMIINKKHIRTYIIKKLIYKKYQTINPSTVIIDKNSIRSKKLNIIKKKTHTKILMKVELTKNTYTFGLFYIYYINIDIPIIKIIKRNTLCNIYIKGKINKSLIYTQNLIKLK